MFGDATKIGTSVPEQDFQPDFLQIHECFFAVRVQSLISFSSFARTPFHLCDSGGGNFPGAEGGGGGRAAETAGKGPPGHSISSESFLKT